MNTTTLPTMKTTVALIALATLSGCVTGPEAQTGTVIGGIIGAATGGIIGHQKGKGLEGAAIGGGIGAIAGNLFGSAQDQRNYNMYMRSTSNQPQPTRQYYSQPTRQYVEPSYRQPTRQYSQPQPRCNPQPKTYMSKTIIISDNDDCNQHNNNRNNNYGYNNQRGNPFYDDYAYGAPPSRDARSNGGLYNAGSGW
jgi:hypothetical protein